MNKKEIIKGTLAWCNDRRSEKGLKALKDLPKGKKYDGESCPCGRACGMYVGYREFFKRVGDGPDPDEWPDSFESQGEIPECVSIFTQKFDKGQYPEYIEEAK